VTLDYFYGNQAEQFSFYRIPKVLFTDERYKSISAESKILYGILLDRISLSQKNGWMDEANRVYIIFTVDEVKESMGCAEQKAVKLLSELENKAGLIERKRQGLGKPNLIFVKNFIVDNSVDNFPNSQESQFKSCENHNSGAMKITAPELPKSQGTNTNQNKTDYSDTDTYPFSSVQTQHHEREQVGQDVDERNRYRDFLERQLEYDILLENHPYDHETLEEMISLVIDTVCSKRQYIRVAGDDKPKEVVKSQLLKLTHEHIEYVLSSFKDNASKVRNIKQYLLASLYNAPMTISSYYDALVRHDMANGFQ